MRWYFSAIHNFLDLLMWVAEYQLWIVLTTHSYIFTWPLNSKWSCPKFHIHNLDFCCCNFMVYFQFVAYFQWTDQYQFQMLNSVNDLSRARVRPVNWEGTAGVAEFLGRLRYAGLIGEVLAAALQVQALQQGDQSWVLLFLRVQLPGQLRAGTHWLRLLL